MRTIHWVALIGSIAAAVIACSSEDDGNDPIGPGKGGSAGGVVGKGGAANKGGAAGSTTNQGGAAGETNQGGAAGETSQGGAAGSGTCVIDEQVKSTTCSDCMKSSCGTEVKACQDNEKCMAIYDCYSACADGDTACEVKCYTDNPDGQAAWFAVDGCSYATCHDDCFCAGTCIFGSEGACNTCLTGKCGTDCNGCDMNNECMSMMQCIWGLDCYGLATEAEQQACMDGCAALFPGGTAPLSAFNTCANAQCTTDCQ